MYIFIEFNTKFTTLIFKFFSDNYNTCWVWSLSSWAAWEWPCQRPCASPCTWRKIMWNQIDHDINYLSSAALKQALQVKMDTQKNNKGKVTRSAASRTNCLKFLTWIYSSKWKDLQQYSILPQTTALEESADKIRRAVKLETEQCLNKILSSWWWGHHRWSIFT